jgi:hypothetical protein
MREAEREAKLGRLEQINEGIELCEQAMERCCVKISMTERFTQQATVEN